MAQIILKVEGMSCEHCVKAVTDATFALPGVEKVNVDLAAGTVAIDGDPAQVSPEDLRDAIEDQGYDVLA